MVVTREAMKVARYPVRWDKRRSPGGAIPLCAGIGKADDTGSVPTVQPVGANTRRTRGGSTTVEGSAT
jgi:hypothetical protein